jgi:hypothetical protein
MQRFVFRFGYCTPKQWAGNDEHGWDDESSGAFIVEATTEEDALRWGRKVADAFVAQLFEKSGTQQPSSWTDAQFANWLDGNPTASFSDEAIRALPTVPFGKMPQFDEWD